MKNRASPVRNMFLTSSSAIQGIILIQGPRSKFSSGGAKEECVKENFGWGGAGGHACGFLFNFSEVTENANNGKTIDFFPHLQ